jgi:hypothetical protein
VRPALPQGIHQKPLVAKVADCPPPGLSWFPPFFTDHHRQMRVILSILLFALFFSIASIVEAADRIGEQAETFHMFPS